MATANGLNHEIKDPVTAQDDLDQIRHDTASAMHANGHRGEVVMLLKTEPVYHAETGELVTGYAHAHHARVRIHDGGYDVLPLE